MTDGTRFGRYLVGERIGSGAMGNVYRATDTHLGRTVALKIVSARLEDSAEAVRRFAHEADVLALIDSPHVLPLLDHGTYDGRAHLVTPYVDGGDLGSLLRARGPMPPASAARLGAQIAAGLADTHRAGVVHRDVKPSNVLVQDADTAHPRALLADFGIAAGPGDPTGPGGTAAYLAPECADGHPATPASDVYAAGCVLWEMLTGRPAYSGSEAEILFARRHAPLPQLVAADPFTERMNLVLRRSLAASPTERYGDAEELRGELLALADLPSTQVRAAALAPAGPGAASGSRRGSRRRRLLGVLAAAVVLALVVAAAVVTVVLRHHRPGHGTVAVAVTRRVTGDVDGDGRGDVVAVSRSSAEPSPTLLTSTGTGFASGVVHPELRGGNVTGDVDGDGRVELVTPGRSRTTVSVLNDGRAVRVAVGDALPHSIGNWLVMGDYDGNGCDDIGRFSRTADGHYRLSVVLSGTDGSFAAATRWIDGTGFDAAASWLAVGDFDADGHDDLAIAHFGRSGLVVRLLRSDGSRLIADPQPAFTDPRYRSGEVTGVYAADVDGDGIDDLVYKTATSTYDSPVLSVWLHHGDAWRQEQWSSAVALGPGWATAVSDVDGDGRDDLVSVLDDHTLVAARSTGSGFERFGTPVRLDRRITDPLGPLG